MKVKFLDDHEGEALRVMGTRATVKVDADETGGALELVVIDAEEGSEVPPHRHPWAETYYMISGEMEVRIGARSDVLRSGAFATIPARAVHSLTVLSDTARFLHMSIGVGATAMYRMLDKEFPNPPAPEDVGRLLALVPTVDVELLLVSEM